MSWPSTSTTPVGRRDDAADDADQRGLAGAVRTQQREDLALADLEVDALQRLQARRVGLGQVRDGDDRRHGMILDDGHVDALSIQGHHSSSFCSSNHDHNDSACSGVIAISNDSRFSA